MMGYRRFPPDLATSEASRRAIHTEFGEGTWLNRRDGVILSRHLERDSAVVEGRRLAMQRQVTLVVHREDGSVDYSEDFDGST